MEIGNPSAAARSTVTMAAEGLTQASVQPADNSFWTEIWTDEDTPDWHITEAHCYLQRFLGELTGKQADNDRQSCRIFVPLCGKSVDMLWLAKQGYEVVGAELVPKAVKSFFTENNLPFATQDVELPSGEKATAYRCTQEGLRITILQCDLFVATAAALGGKFHAVWDRGSLVAIAAVDRVKYVAFLEASLNPGGRVLLECFQYDQFKMDGPPFSFSGEQLNSLLGGSFHLRELAREEFEEIGEPLPGRIPLAHKRCCHLLTLK